ncbi:MAG: Ig-like domain-containing protein [Gemmatimonadetes bacterium]|nr:Ig-like domain-containing protein [Gemmatimonadota bacterium]
MPFPRPAARFAALALVGALALHACSSGNSGGTAPVTPPGGGGTTPVGPAPVASVTVTPASCALIPGGSCTLTAATLDAAGVALSGRPITWSAATPAVATVSAAGVVTAVAVGSTVITATAEGRSATASVTVTPVPVASVAITPVSAALRVGGRQAFSATARDAGGATLAGRPVTWSSSAAAVAVVDTAGTVSAVAPGSATITAIIEGRTATAAVTVTQVPVATVAVSPAAPTLRVGATLPMTASARDSAGGVLTGRPVTWQSSTPAVASITAAGVVTGVAPGTATITATVEGRAATAVVTVERVPVASVSITPTSVALLVDSTAQLATVARDSAGATLADRPAAWASSAPAVAQVSASGVLRGIAPGTATITATVEGRTATATVRVSALLTLRMYYSATLTGPWAFKTVSIRGGDALEVVDPSPVLMPDGRILLYYLMNYQRGGDPASNQPGNQWKMGVAESTDHGESFTERGTAFTSPVAITDPFPMVLADGRIRMLYAQTVAGTSQVLSATSADSTGLTLPYAADPGTRSIGASIPGALRIGATYYLYTCAEGISYATSTDGLTFGARAVAISSYSGITCDPSPISTGPSSHVMAFKTRPMGSNDPRSDSTYLATSTNGTSWTRLPTPVGPGSVPGLVRDRNGLYRIYVVYFPPR